jgi:hypothetical protein
MRCGMHSPRPLSRRRVLGGPSARSGAGSDWTALCGCDRSTCRDMLDAVRSVVESVAPSSKPARWWEHRFPPPSSCQAEYTASRRTSVLYNAQLSRLVPSFAVNSQTIIFSSSAHLIIVDPFFVNCPTSSSLAPNFHPPLLLSSFTQPVGLSNINGTDQWLLSN